MSKPVTHKVASIVKKKGTVAALSFTAACFSLTGFASACAETNAYTGSDNWNDYNKASKSDSYTKGGYDWTKHSDQVKHASYQKDDNSSDKHDSDWKTDDHASDWKSDDSKDDSHDYSKDYEHEADQAVWHEDESKDDNHDKGGYGQDQNHWTEDEHMMVMSHQSNWGEWSPQAWMDQGHSYQEWHDGFTAYVSSFNWSGGSHDVMPEQGDNWDTDCVHYSPAKWMERGSSMQNWHDQLMQHAGDWESQWDTSSYDEQHHDKGGYGQTDDEWNKDDSHDSDWKSDDSKDYGKDYDHEADKDAGYDEDYNKDHEDDSSWGGSVTSAPSHGTTSTTAVAVAYVVTTTRN